MRRAHFGEIDLAAEGVGLDGKVHQKNDTVMADHIERVHMPLDHCGDIGALRPFPIAQPREPVGRAAHQRRCGDPVWLP